MLLIVTRPEPDCSRTAQALAAVGHRPIASPALEIIGDTEARLPAARFQAVAVTSSNAVRALAGHPDQDSLLALPLFAVGDQTALEAHRSGFRQARSAGGTAADLARLIAAALRPDEGPVLYAAGESQAADLAGELRGAGFLVETVVVYRAEPRLHLAPAAAAALRHGTADGVLFYSRQSAAAFASALRAAGLAPIADHIACFCLAPASAEPLAAVTSGPVVVAERPDQISLFACIEAVSARALAGSTGN